MKSIAIIGGGISGIAAAFFAGRQGLSVDLYEADQQLGGRIGCTDLDGRSVEFGGKNIGLRYRRFREFAQTLPNISFEEFGLNSSRAINGRVARFNKDGARLRTLAQVWRMCGARGMLQLLPHTLAIKLNAEQGFLHSSYFDQRGRSGDLEPLSTHFTQTCTDNFIRTLTVRMNAAEPDECYIGNFGSNLGLVLDKYEQVVGGMRQVLGTFQNQFDTNNLLLGQPVTAIVPHGNGGVRIDSMGTHGTLSRDYDHVVIAVPAHAASSLLAETSPELAKELQQVRYFPVAVLIARYQDDVFPARQRAMVFGADSPLSNAGAYGINDLNMVRYTFSGRTARNMINADTSAEDALMLAESRLAPHFNISDNSCDTYTYRYMRNGLCAYSAHHGERLDRMIELTPLHGGISLTGDYWRGASIEACFHASDDVLNRLVA